jgi:formate transporter
MSSRDSPVPPPSGLDALLPDAIARKAEEIGVAKAKRDTLPLFALAVLAGAFIAFGALFATVALTESGAMPYGAARVLAGLVFALGLILIVVGGAELFTGDVLMVMAWASKRLKLAAMLRAWAIIYAGNLVGAVGTAVLVFLSGHHGFAQGAIGATALSIATDKTALPFGQALVLGVLANVLVCMAVWAALGARSVTDKVLVITPPIAAFVAAGFEHSIANMYFISYGWLIRHGADAGFWGLIGRTPAEFATITLGGFLANLAPVTIGNFIGGAVLVGIVYWFIFLRRG